MWKGSARVVGSGVNSKFLAPNLSCPRGCSRGTRATPGCARLAEAFWTHSQPTTAPRRRRSPQARRAGPCAENARSVFCLPPREAAHEAHGQRPGVRGSQEPAGPTHSPPQRRGAVVDRRRGAQGHALKTQEACFAYLPERLLTRRTANARVCAARRSLLDPPTAHHSAEAPSWTAGAARRAMR